jgi:ABC-type phosphate transport system substrate-binding protein
MKTLLLGIVLALGLPRVAAAQVPPPKEYVVVVNSFNPFVVVQGEYLARLFLKKDSTWMNGQTAYPVDQADNAQIRERFASSVLRKNMGALRSYWRQRVFSGEAVPPPALETDDAVLEFVRRNPYAVGYVSTTTSLGANVRAIRVEQ